MIENQCNSCHLSLDNEELFCYNCGFHNPKPSNMRKFVQSNVIKTFVITSFFLIGSYYLVMTFYLWFELSFVDDYSNLLLIPVIALPIISGGFILSSYGIVRDNKGVKPFGLFFVILGIVQLILLQKYYEMMVLMDQLLGNSSISVQLLQIFISILSQPMLRILFLGILTLQLIYLRNFEGKIIPFNGYLVPLKKLQARN